MDLSPRGLTQRARVAHDIMAALCKTLPRTFTPGMEAESVDLAVIASRGLNNNAVFKRAIEAVLDHPELPLAIVISLTSKQCESSLKLSKMESLDQHIVFISLEQMAAQPRDRDTVPPPVLPHLRHYPMVWVRLEIVLTRQKDVLVHECYVTDPRLILDRCAHCGDRVSQLRKCSGCKSAQYCGAECQLADWPEHKKVCKK